MTDAAAFEEIGNETRSGSYSGVVLAGGRSSRFGRDKALHVYRGKPLLRWALDSLTGAGERMVIADRDYPNLEVSVHPDLISGGSSLGGLHAALSYARHDWVALAACDMPFLTPAYWEQLWARRGAAPLVVATNQEGGFEPLAALYHRALLPLVTQKLAQGDLRMSVLASQAGASFVSWRDLAPHVDARLFLNVNTPDQLPP